ncbi:energy transducer TonB [Hymenobacter pini]|uniref:energy transducer TonB n=1 Tax=Hymenobacter pini TaxID=2880879 RepID=UPI001CF36AD4|nr:energy transducer TonB [Hymenobacter pini]MCA8830384.1 TonB family protein [Hymenobacter pini]
MAQAQQLPLRATNQPQPIRSTIFQGFADRAVTSAEEAVYRVKLIEVPGQMRLDSIYFVASGRLASVATITWALNGDTLLVVEGWRENGKRNYVRHQRGKKTHGEYLNYDTQGRLREKTNYLDGKKSASECYTKTGAPGPCSNYVYTEKMPEYPGGSQAMLAYIARTMRYPSKALEQRHQGRVFVTFVVAETGEVRCLQVQQGVSPELDAEALRVLRSLPRFEPGLQNGETVAVYYTVPVTFALK